MAKLNELKACKGLKLTMNAFLKNAAIERQYCDEQNSDNLIAKRRFLRPHMESLDDMKQVLNIADSKVLTIGAYGYGFFFLMEGAEEVWAIDQYDLQVSWSRFIRSALHLMDHDHFESFMMGLSNDIDDDISMILHNWSVYEKKNALWMFIEFLEETKRDESIMIYYPYIQSRETFLFLKSRITEGKLYLIENELYQVVKSLAEDKRRYDVINISSARRWTFMGRHYGSSEHQVNYDRKLFRALDQILNTKGTIYEISTDDRDLEGNFSLQVSNFLTCTRTTKLPGFRLEERKSSIFTKNRIRIFVRKKASSVSTEQRKEAPATNYVDPGQSFAHKKG